MSDDNIPPTAIPLSCPTIRPHGGVEPSGIIRIPLPAPLVVPPTDQSPPVPGNNK